MLAAPRAHQAKLQRCPSWWCGSGASGSTRLVHPGHPKVQARSLTHSPCSGPPPQIMEAYTDCQLWERLVDGGHRNIKQHFSVEMARPVVLQVGRGWCIGWRWRWAGGVGTPSKVAKQPGEQCGGACPSH